MTAEAADATSAQRSTPQSLADIVLGRVDETVTSRAVYRTAEVDGKPPSGRRVEVVAIEAGESKNRRLYEAEVLREACRSGLFESIPVYANHPGPMDDTHDVRTIVGRFTGGSFSEQLQAVVGEVTFLSGESFAWIREVMAEMPELLKFSIYADAEFERVFNQVGEFQRVDIKKLVEVLSLDLVDFPGAGGRTLRVLERARRSRPHEGEESRVSDDTIKARVMEAERTMERQHADQVAKIKEAHGQELQTLRGKLAEAEAKAGESERELGSVRESLAKLEKSVEDLQGKLDAEKERSAVAETQQVVEARLAEADLPEASAKRVRKVFEGRAAKVETIDQVIEEQRAFVAELGLERRVVTGAGPAPEAPASEAVDKEAGAVAEAFVGEFARMMGVGKDD